MGKNNKARRAAKAKQRARRGTPRNRSEQGGFSHDPFGFTAPPPTRRQQVMDILLQLEKSVLRGTTRDGFADHASWLARRLQVQPDNVVDELVEEILSTYVAALWAGGWQPAEVRREASRSTPTAAAARLAEWAILADDDRRLGQPSDPRWVAQIAELPLRSASTRGSWLASWRERERLDPADALVCVAWVVRALAPLPTLDVLIPPPGARPTTRVTGPTGPVGRAEDPILRRVRKLLAKAESTAYDEEAEALTAKAHQLMVRHAIDHATIDGPPPSDVPVLIRIPVDAPYTDAKAVLLSVVAEAYRSRSVQLASLGMCTVVGHESDLNVVELMFSSLLVQAQSALNMADRASAGRRSRTQAFRASFFVSYAHRIGERLVSSAAEVFTEAGEVGRQALPVLRDRAAAVDDAFDARFGDALVASHVRGGFDHLGSAAGRSAADEAKLDSGALLW